MSLNDLFLLMSLSEAIHATRFVAGFLTSDVRLSTNSTTSCSVPLTRQNKLSKKSHTR